MLDRIRLGLAEHNPLQPTLDDPKKTVAAVAAILRESESAGTEILFIKRAQRAYDPWSGHIAFPGGHFEDQDKSIVDTAVRETLEETGLDLQENGKLLGPLCYSDITSRHGGRLILACHVFTMDYNPATQEHKFSPNSEVDELIWAPLPSLFAGKGHIMHLQSIGEKERSFPGYAIDKHIVWGLTYMMLTQLFSLIDSNWVAPSR